MAQSITINLDDAEDATLTRLTNEYNAAHAGVVGFEPLSPSQFLRREVRDDLKAHAAEFTKTDQLGMRAAYKLATPAEQATIDAILAPYRSGV